MSPLIAVSSRELNIILIYLTTYIYTTTAQKLKNSWSFQPVYCSTFLSIFSVFAWTSFMNCSFYIFTRLFTPCYVRIWYRRFQFFDQFWGIICRYRGRCLDTLKILQVRWLVSLRFLKWKGWITYGSLAQ